MNDFAEVVVLVEGQTELQFVADLLGPYLAREKVFLTPVILDKPGEKGGDVRFSRAKNDIGKYLKQRNDTYVTLMVDYYGINNDWPGYYDSKQQTEHTLKAEIMNMATAEEVRRRFPEQNPRRRFIPYVSMYEIEALFFSDPEQLVALE